MRFRQVVVRAETQAFDLVLFEPARGEHDDREVGLLPHLLEQRETITTRHGEVKDDEVGAFRIDHRQRLVAIRRLERRQVLARERQRAANERADIRLVVDDEDLHVASGRDVTNAAPPPGFSSYSSVPPWRVTRERAIASPRPEPGVPLALFPRKNFSKMRCRSSDAIPGPWSRTSMRSASPCRCAATRMGVP